MHGGRSTTRRFHHRHGRRASALRGAIAIALALAVASVSSPARAEPLPRVGVVIVLTVNATEERAVDIAGALGEAIAETLAVDVVAGADAGAALPREGIPDGCIAEQECVRDLGERLDVDEILALVVVEVGERTQIEPTWIGVSEGRTVSRAALAFEEGEDPADLFRRRAPELLPGAARREADDPPAEKEPAGAEVEEVVGEPTRAEEAIGKGERGRRMTPAAYTAAGVGALALSAGIGFGVATRSLYSSCDGGGCDDGDGTRIRRRALAADALFAAAAISGGVAAILYWRSGSDGERDTYVGAGPGGVGVSIGGRF